MFLLTFFQVHLVTHVCRICKNAQTKIKVSTQNTKYTISKMQQQPPQKNVYCYNFATRRHIEFVPLHNVFYMIDESSCVVALELSASADFIEIWILRIFGTFRLGRVLQSYLIHKIIIILSLRTKNL